MERSTQCIALHATYVRMRRYVRIDGYGWTTLINRKCNQNTIIFMCIQCIAIHICDEVHNIQVMSTATFVHVIKCEYVKELRREEGSSLQDANYAIIENEMRGVVMSTTATVLLCHLREGIN
jgi:hypothetical protein